MADGQVGMSVGRVAVETLPVDISSVTQMNDLYKQYIVKNLVDDPVICYANAYAFRPFNFLYPQVVGQPQGRAGPS